MKPSDMAKALVVTAEIMGWELSPNAAAGMAIELGAYPVDGVAKALKRCQREVTGRLSLAAIIQRIDDGHPGAEEAWALCPRDESQTVVWTEETCEAFGSVLDLVANDDWIGARMAFKETYLRLVAEARDVQLPARWVVSLGHDQMGRGGPVREALAKGRLTEGQALPLLDGLPDEHRALPTGDRSAPPASAGELLRRARPEA